MVGNEEVNIGSIRTINDFEEILPIPDPKPNSVGKKLIDLAQGYGLSDMHDVVADVLDLGKHTKLTEVKNSKGEIIGYQPEIGITVTLDNAWEMQRKLTAGMVVCYALLVNDRFRTHWDSRFEEGGLFGATWVNGYYEFDRGKTSPDTFIDVMNAYMNQTKVIQDWQRKQIDGTHNLLNTIKGKMGKKD